MLSDLADEVHPVDVHVLAAEPVSEGLLQSRVGDSIGFVEVGQGGFGDDDLEGILDQPASSGKGVMGPRSQRLLIQQLFHHLWVFELPSAYLNIEILIEMIKKNLYLGLSLWKGRPSPFGKRDYFDEKISGFF